jgi:hypothetical protein
LIVRPGAGREVIGVPVKTAIRCQTLPLPNPPRGRELPPDFQYVRAVFEMGAETLLVPDLNAIVQSFWNTRPALARQ